MKIALAQIDVVPGMPRKNLETMLSMIKEAKQNRVDLIAFPEMCIGGYLVGDKWCDESFCENLMQFNEKIMEASEGIAIAYGNIFLDKEIQKRVGEGYFPNKDGRIRKYNAVYVFQNGKPAKRKTEIKFLPEGIQPKTLLPTYRVFDDQRYFFSNTDIAKDFGISLESLLQPFLIEVEGKKITIGFELCEDLWCEDYRRNKKALNPTKILIENGAQYIVNLSASPWTFGKNKARDKRIEFIKKDIGNGFVPFFYVNCIGAQNNGKNILTFDGGSTVYNKEGLPIILNEKYYAEELIIVTEKDLEGKVLERNEEPKIAQKYRAIVRGIQHLKDMPGAEEHPKFLIGLSGGVDSSVVAALLTKAVGDNKVFGINMPTQFNSEKTQDAAARVAEALGIGYEIIPIEEFANLNEKILELHDLDGTNRKFDAAQKGNIATKIRGTAILSNLAAKYHALFTNNGNKWEISFGYATLYGDVNGAVCPIGDLTKAEVFDLAKYLNQEVFRREVIPNELLPDELYCFKKEQIEPSAELEENQVDPIKTGYHDTVLMEITDYRKRSGEDIMRHYLEGTLDELIEKNLGKEDGYGIRLMKRWKINNSSVFIEDLENFIKMINWSVFKRVQTPPIIITSKSAFGYDIRESILPYEPSLQHQKLKEKILAMKEYKSQRLK